MCVFYTQDILDQVARRLNVAMEEARKEMPQEPKVYTWLATVWGQSFCMTCCADRPVAVTKTP